MPKVVSSIYPQPVSKFFDLPASVCSLAFASRQACRSPETTTKILRLVLRRQGSLVCKPTKESWITEKLLEIHCLVFYNSRIACPSVMQCRRAAARHHTCHPDRASELNVFYWCGETNFINNRRKFVGSQLPNSSTCQLHLALSRSQFVKLAGQHTIKTSAPSR